MLTLINMPFASITYPNLALGQFKARLGEAGLPCRVLDLNLYLARMIGYGGYQNIARFRDGIVQPGEWLFAPHAWGDSFKEDPGQFLSECAEDLGKVSRMAEPEKWLTAVYNEVIPDFLEKALALLCEGGLPSAVGFTCSFFQTVPALALGRLIRARHPGIRLVYGGANFHAEMGEELMEKVPWVDAVSTGEADDVVVPLFGALAEGRCPEGLQGVLYRDPSGEVCEGPPRRPVSQAVFTALPDPDFDDFFESATKTGWDHHSQWQKNLHLFFEGSRGCWWGEKCQCTYCGLNGVGMGYRYRSGDSVYETLSRYVTRYPEARIQPSDNNMSPEYFETLLPKLAKSPFRDRIRFLYETRATIGRPQVEMLSAASVAYFHPGIESFSTHALKCMKKGTRAIRNVYCLKLCREYGLVAFWNYLVRVPGERPEDYREAAALIPKIVHLQPPCRGRTSRIECVRFSAYFAERKWVENVRPKPWYALLFPEDTIDLSRVAYFFDADWKGVLAEGAYDPLNEQIVRWFHLWQETAELPDLVITGRGEDGAMEISDTRTPETPRAILLDPARAAVYALTFDPVSLDGIAAGLSAGEHRGLTQEQIRGMLDGFEEDHLVIREKKTYLGLALPAGTESPPKENRWVR